MKKMLIISGQECQGLSIFLLAQHRVIYKIIKERSQQQNRLITAREGMTEGLLSISRPYYESRFNEQCTNARLIFNVSDNMTAVGSTTLSFIFLFIHRLCMQLYYSYFRPLSTECRRSSVRKNKAYKIHHDLR